MCKSIVYTIFFNLPFIVILLRVDNIHYYEFGGCTCFNMCMAPPLSQFTPTHNVTRCAPLQESPLIFLGNFLNPTCTVTSLSSVKSSMFSFPLPYLLVSSPYFKWQQQFWLCEMNTKVIVNWMGLTIINKILRLDQSGFILANSAVWSEFRKWASDKFNSRIIEGVGLFT